MMERFRRPSLAVDAARAAGVVLTLLMFWSAAAAVGSSAAAATTVRVGVVLDLTSDVGRESLGCISTALDDFHREHRPSGAMRVELRVRDSRGEVIAAAHAAEDLIKNAQVEAVILGLQTWSEADFVAHMGQRKPVPILSFAGISPTPCALWLQDPVTASRGHGKIGITLGNDTIIFHDLESDRRNARELETTISRKKCRGQKIALKIAVPMKNGFQAFVNVTHPNSVKQIVTGYCIEVFETAMRNLQNHPCYKFSIFYGTYDELVGNVSSGVYDGAVGDVTITAKRVAGTDFTMPYTQSGVSMLVLAENDSETIQWTFVKPLTRELWFAIVGFFFYTAFVLWMIERSRNHEYQGSSLEQFSTASYFAFSTLTFSHGQIIKSPLSKIVVVIWCFVVLILVQSYTASLSSILTAKRLRPSVTNLDQLRLNDDFVGYHDQSFMRSILISRGIRENRLRSYTNKEEYANALRKGSKNGGVSAMVDEVPYLTSLLSDHRYKNDFKMVGSIYKTPGFGFAFSLGSPIVHNLSRAILDITGGDLGSQIEAKWFGTVPLLTGAGTVPDTDSTPLTLQGFSGLFIITGSISTLMLLISIARLVIAKCTEVTDGSGNNDLSQNGPDQPIYEAIHHNTNEGGESVGNEESGPLQKDGMHIDLLPAESIQGTNSSHAGSQAVDGNNHGGEDGVNIVVRSANLDSNTISAHGGTNCSNNHETKNLVP